MINARLNTTKCNTDDKRMLGKQLNSTWQDWQQEAESQAWRPVSYIFQNMGRNTRKKGIQSSLIMVYTISLRFASWRLKSKYMYSSRIHIYPHFNGLVHNYCNSFTFIKELL